MARILCSYSGLEIKVQHFPLYNTARESHHPIFDLNSSNLLEFSDKYISGNLSEPENYLYYLALFNSTNLVDFRVPAAQTTHTQSIIANNMISLIRMVERIDILGPQKVTNKLCLPRFVISPETKTLNTSHDWLAIWESNYKDYQTGYITSTALEKISRKEANLEKLIKDKTKDVSTYAGILAEWASLAGAFDIHANYDVLDEKNNTVLMKDYWKKLIKMCAKGDAIFHVPQIDLQDLIEHCEETIDHGTIYAHELMSLLRSAAERKHRYLDLGDIDVTSTYRILDADASVEDANMLALIDSAPKEKPLEKDYPNKLAYIRAKMKYDLAIAYEREHPAVSMNRRVGDMLSEPETDTSIIINTDTASNNQENL